MKRLTAFILLASIVIPLSVPCSSEAAEPKVFNLEPPKTKALRKKQLTRSSPILVYKFKGYIGENNEGMLAVRDLTGAPKAEHDKIKKIVNEENTDRAAIYKEIIKFNKLNDKEQKMLIKATSDTLRAVDAKGTYFYDNKKWQKKY